MDVFVHLFVAAGPGGDKGYMNREPSFMTLLWLDSTRSFYYTSKHKICSNLVGSFALVSNLGAHKTLRRTRAPQERTRPGQIRCQ